MQLNIHKFLTVCTHLAFESSRIIKHIHETASLKTFLKGVNDPVTEADYKVQQFIVKGLKQYWPQLTIVGEEDKDFVGEIQYDFKTLEHNIFSQKAFSIGKQKQVLSKTIDMSKMTVWIDPLDGTLSYTQGYLDQVTTMIGASYQGRARLGVIGSHYKKKLINNKIEYEFSPRVFVGNSLESQAYEIDSNLQVSSINPRKHNKQNRLCISRSRMTPESLKRMQNISNHISRVGGSGKKALQVIQNKSDSFVYLGQGIGSWDVCAPQALIRSINGIETKANGQIIDYKIIGKQLLQGGTVLSIDQQIHQEVLQKIRTFKY